MAYKVVELGLEQKFRVEEGNFKVNVKITKDHIELGDNFIFKSSNSEATLVRWENVLRLLLEAVLVTKNRRLGHPDYQLRLKEGTKKVKGKAKKS